MRIIDKRESGFTLVELVIVIAILAIIVAIAIPKLTGYKSVAEERVCAANRKTVEKIYNAFLLENDMDNQSDFDQFLIENFKMVCPVGGVISYEDGKVKCSIHGSGSEGDEDEDQGEEVPWL